MWAWICLRHLTSRLIKITKHKSYLQSSVFCLNRTKITHSTGNYFFYGQPRWILISSTNKNVMKDKSWMYLRHLTSSLRKITKHKYHLQSSVFWLNQTKIAHSTGNEVFYGQSKWILISTDNTIFRQKKLVSRRKLHPRVMVDQAGRPLPPKKNLAFW